MTSEETNREGTPTVINPDDFDPYQGSDAPDGSEILVGMSPLILEIFVGFAKSEVDGFKAYARDLVCLGCGKKHLANASDEQLDRLLSALSQVCSE